MFSIKKRNITILGLIAALMLWANIGITQTEWDYPGNLVLDLGASGEWDGVHVSEPTVLFDGTEYQMWYAGQWHGLPYRIGLATSPDGITWEKHLGNPVLDSGASGTWDDFHVFSPTVLFDGTEYKMWYAGGYSNSRIGYATSTDGIVWVKHPNPVLDVGEYGTWDDHHLRSPMVLFDGAEYQMWYAGSSGGPSIYRIGYATSTDGIVWVKHPNPVLDIGEYGTWDDYNLYSLTVLFDGIEYQMWYTGFDGSYSRIGYATSADGIVWVKYPDNPVREATSGTWESPHVGDPTVLFDGNKYQMWYTGGGGSVSSRIGYATSIPDIVTATIDFDPNVLNLKSRGKWVTVYIELPEGYDVNDIDVNTILLEGVIEVQNSDVQDGVLMVKFDRQDVIYYIENILGITSGDVTLTVTGELADETLFEGSDTITVISEKGKGKAAPALLTFNLGQNFRNPFNPDTWIPYTLANDVDVVIRIYSLSGQPVRTLDLGHQPAGHYATKNKAVYWDGKNNFGESVASGVYFYTLQAGKFRATRKMVILK
jgi:predicted GH43/DUF377 family glycosyl hydrolase